MHFIKNLNYIFALPAFSILFYLTGCGISGAESDDDTFLIQVDSVAAPESVALGDTVVINFFGRIGTNGCFYFSHFEVSETDNQIEIEAYGGYTGSRFCPEVIVELDGEAYRYVPESRGTKVIHVLRPENGPLEHIVNVE